MYQSLSPVWLFATPWTVTDQAPVSMGFSRQEYWKVSHSVVPDSLWPHACNVAQQAPPSVGFSRHHCKLPLPEWYPCYHRWTCKHASSPKVHSLCYGSLLALCFQWVWTGVFITVVWNPLCSSCSLPSLTPNAGNYFWKPFYCLLSFSFSGMSHNWPHIVSNLFTLASFT